LQRLTSLKLDETEQRQAEGRLKQIKLLLCLTQPCAADHASLTASTSSTASGEGLNGCNGQEAGKQARANP
jgi:hypothetical protein